MDDDEPIIVGERRMVRRGHMPGPEWTLVRCARCRVEASIPTHDLPLDRDPVRDEDGVRLGTCPKCTPRPNRAQRRAP